MNESIKKSVSQVYTFLLLVGLMASCAPHTSEQEAMSESIEEALVPEEADGLVPNAVVDDILGF